MPTDKLTPTDSRVTHHTATVREKTYHYILSEPERPPIGTALLAHGFPDLAFGWRYQVPFLTSLGLRVIVPDMLGYGQTDSPDDDLHAFGHKSTSADLAELVTKICPGESIILGGHDWGGALVWRMALWHPSLVRAVFSVGTPYVPPSTELVDVVELGKRMPTLEYMTQFAGPDLVREVVGDRRIRGFLNGLYGGVAVCGEAFFDMSKGMRLDLLDDGIGQSPLLTEEEVDYYVKEYLRHGLKGPTNWYRLGEVNYEDEMALLKDGQPKIKAPALLISPTNDLVIPPSMADGMEKDFDHVEKKLVKAGHWAMWEASEEVNGLIREFLDGVLKSD